MHGPYVTAGDLVRRTGLRPRAVLSLTMAGAFDGIASNRREALWEAGLHPRSSRNGQAALPVSRQDDVPRLADFTERERMSGEYEALGLYPRGHLMEFVRPGLGSQRAYIGGGRGPEATKNVSRWPGWRWRGSTRAGGTARCS